MSIAVRFGEYYTYGNTCPRKPLAITKKIDRENKFSFWTAGLEKAKNPADSKEVDLFTVNGITGEDALYIIKNVLGITITDKDTKKTIKQKIDGKLKKLKKDKFDNPYASLVESFFRLYKEFGGKIKNLGTGFDYNCKDKDKSSQ